MTTSLAAQLKKLAAPQTSLLTHSKKKPSLLFDPREAAKFDRDTIYEIGISGLQELIKLNPKFAEYETSLFNSDSRSVERSVEDKKANKKLNKLIRHFLLLLSPYFLIKASHKALEWLINRYHIESFNVDDLMSLIFPYHSTRIFVRVLQIMDLSDPANKWHWLYPLQGPGVPLSKQALLNRCASDPFFMHFICKTTSDAVKEHKGRGSSLATLLAFHCTTLIGGLEYANKVNEVQMTHILKTLLEGLASPVIDYAAASYMIMGQLVLRVKLSHHIFSGILNKVVKCPHSSLSGECLLLIVLMYQNQYTEDMPPVQTKTFNRLIRLSWLPRALKQLKDAGVHVNLFFESLLREVLLNIQSSTEDREEICKFAENLLDNMMDSNSAIHIMEIILQTLDVDSLTLKEEALPEGKKDAEKENNEDDGEKKEENEDKEEEDDEEEKERIEKGKEEDGAEKKEDEDDDNEKEKNEECKEGNKHGKARQYEENKTELTTLGISDREEILKWYLQVFKNLEKKYSEAYDILIHRYLSKENASNNCARAIRLVLSVAVEGAGAGTADRIDMFQRLHHPSSALRAAAVKHLVDNYATLSEDDRELIFSSLGARLKDEDRKVLRNVLLFPTKVLVEVLGADTALEELISLSVCCFDKDKKWTEVWILLVQHLCSEQLHADTPFAEVRILFALLPFFFIHTRRICRVIMNQHNFVKKFKLLTSLTKELKPSEKLKKWEICSAFINSLTEAQTSLDTETLFQCAKYFTSKKQKAMHIFLLLLVVGSSVPEHLQLSLSQSILDLFTSCISTYKVPVVPGEIMESSGMVLSQCGKKVLSGEIPLSAYLFCISKLTQNTLLSSYLKSNDRKWWDLDFSNEDGDKTALRFTVRMLEVILTGCSASSRNVRFCYAVCLKQYFKAHFSNLASQVRFLCNVCACPGTKDDGIAWPELKLRCLRLLTTLLEVPNSSFSWALNLSEPVVPALMTAAFSPVTPLRHTALNCLLKIGSSFGANLNDDTYVALLDKIKERYEEIMMDPDQLSVVMYTALSPDPAVQSLLEPSEKPQLNGIRTTLLNCITSRDTPAYVVRTLLQMMGAINSKGIMFSLTPLGHAALKSGVLDGWLDEYRSGILCEVIQRLDSDTAECLQRKECWDFLQTALLDWKTNVIQSSGERTYPSVLVLQQISRELFDKLTETTQAELLSLIIRAASDSDAPEVGSAASKAVKKIILDSKLVATELEKMKNAEIPEEQQTASGMRLRTKRKVNQAPSPLLLQTEAWRHGVTLLEWIQSKKKLQSTQLLLSPLFSVLSKCLEFEQQPPVEYTKQLVLSCLLHCCQKLSPDGSLVDKSIVQAFNVEAIVQCIRASQNPQTHHHALLLLAHIAGMMPEQVLHNIMAIFTFMGSSVLRHDDAYSFQVISKIVDTVIPILVKASEGMTEKNLEVDGAVCSVLRVFADTVLHVPEHRRMLLYQKLLTTLGPDTSLWLFICLVLEGHVVHGQEEQSEKNKRERGEIPHRQEFALNLTRCFPPSSVITTCIKLMKYVQTLPSEKGQTAKSPKPTSSLALSLVPGLFNVDVHTAKELRHYRFSVCTFMSSLLSSPQFVKQVAELSDEDILQLEPLYQELIENLLTYIKSLSHQHHQAMQKNKPEQTIKYWSAVLNVSYDILDKVNALLPCDMFLLVIRGLLNHKLSTIRRKSMELLNTRLQHQASIFSKCERQAFYNLLEPLVTVMGSIGLEGTDPDTEINQQVAMLSIKLLARQLAPDDPAHFKQILERVIELMRSPEVQKNLLASVVLCLAELISSLRAHAIGHLNQFMPAIIGILRDQKELESPNLVLLSVVTATQKIVEILPNFLSPYLDKLLFEISIQSTKWQHLSEDNKVAPVHNKLKTIRQKISSTIPARVLTPAVGRCYTQLIEQGQYSALGPLLGILGESFSSLASSEFSQIMPDLTSFFLSALQFRGDSGDSVPQEDIVEVESHVTKALVALILKLSESTFRPLYYSLFHWATSVEAHKDRIITFYGLSSSIAEALKGLFVLFAGRLIQNAAKLLDVLNVSKKNKEEKDEKVVFDDEKAQLLLQYILQTLHRIFLHDSGQGFINKERFDALMFPLTNQLENTLGGVDQLQFRATALLSPCISQFAVAVADDALWKQLNYQILLKTRNDLPQVRLAALEVLCEMARKLGEDFLPLLPETVPFLAELLEDEEETVETACQKAVQDLEEILGEPIKKYF